MSITAVISGANSASQEFAENTFRRGTDYLSPQLMRDAFPALVQIPDKIPNLPSEEVLVRLKNAGCSIIFMPAGVTAEALHDVTDNQTGDGKNLFCNTGWYEKNNFFTTKTTGEEHLRVFSTQPLPVFGGKNYLEQTLVAVEIAAQLGVNLEIVARVKDEVLSQELDIRHLLSSDWAEAACRLVKLEANQRFCSNFAQQMFYVTTYERVNGVRLTGNVLAWTNSLSGRGGLVNSGNFDRGGVGVNADYPGSSGGSLWRFFSCDVEDLAG